MKDLATQAADASSTATDKTAMQSEYDALGKELANVLKNTTFAGTALLVGAGTIGSTAGMTFQIGASANETMAVNLSADMTTMENAVSAATKNYTAAATGTELTGSANATITLLETALAGVGTVRSGLGASANRLEHVYNNLANISTNSKAATGLIMDVDFASESANMTANQMLLQAGTAMLKQTNSMSSMVMSLLQ
jgi:flagellin